MSGSLKMPRRVLNEFITTIATGAMAMSV